MRASNDQYLRIYYAWKKSLPPMQIAKQLKLVPLTVIREYLRLDEGVSS